jgi:Pyruvate/2-oxoacid:ferredoxin oxidoreductase delta subunit
MVYHRPVLDEERCTGCGMCIYHCDAEPSAFELVIPEEVEG